jgi:hypothetical protein
VEIKRMEHKGNVEEKETEVKEKSKIKLSMGNSERKNYNKFYFVSAMSSIDMSSDCRWRRQPPDTGMVMTDSP